MKLDDRNPCIVLLLMLGCVTSCLQAPGAVDVAMSADERRTFSLLLTFSERRLVGTVQGVKHASNFGLTINLRTGDESFDVKVGGDGKQVHVSELVRIRGLLGSEVAVGLHRVAHYGSASWHIKTFDLHAAIRRIAEVRDLFDKVESASRRSDWFARALEGEKGSWDSYLHNGRYEDAEFTRLDDLLEISDPSELRRDLIGWLCRNVGQPEVPWVFPSLPEKWGHGQRLDGVQDLTTHVLGKLFGLSLNSIYSGGWGHFELSRRLWILEEVLTSQRL